MEKKKTNGATMPTDYFFAQDAEGKIHWYKDDPMSTTDRSKIEIDINQEVADFSGGSTIANPTRVRLFVAAVDRCRPFAISQPNDIRTGRIKCHFRDQAGHVVEILQHPCSDTKFPLIGVCMDRNGTVSGTATYSTTGECSDGIEDHNLWCVEGDGVERKCCKPNAVLSILCR